MSVKIVSLNVRGIREVVKRRAIFNYYRNRGDIVCIQESHSSTNDELIWQAEYGGDIIFNHGDTNARGVCILMPKGMKSMISNEIKDCDGRILIISLILHEYHMTICNVYAPNKDTPSFFTMLQSLLINCTEHLIIVGDFNLVLDHSLDRIGATQDKKKSLAVLKAMMQDLCIVDIWRIKNPNERKFSWYKLRPELRASRIDFCLLSLGLVDKCENTGYFTGLFSDHLAYYLYLKLSRNERGAGYWKLNAQHLLDKDYIDQINECLDSAIRNTQHKTAKERWEYMKFRIREQSLEYSRNKASEIDLIIAQLSEYITDMEHVLEDANLTLLEKTKEDLNEFMTEKSKSCIFRSKVRFVEFGEKPTKYFLNMEKTRYNARTCDALYENDDEMCTLITDTKGILALQEKFYGELYTSDESVKFDYVNTSATYVPEELICSQGRIISLDEMATATKQLPNGKTCGNDGIPIEFYKVFWNKLKQYLLDALLESFDDSCLFQSALIGTVNLIPKATKNMRFLKNRRPITVLNSDYKILEKVIANRIEPALEHIINCDQRGFMKNRRISTNIRTIFELITHTDKEQLEAIILSLDFMKCFDRIEFCALTGSMEFFHFSPYLIKWTKILYRNFQINIQNNGHFSKRIDVGRGVHQGGPCSSLYFLICAETLAIMLRENQQIQGIPVNDFLNLLGQYADDADLYLKNEQESLNSVFCVLEEFRMLSGFALNYDKTTILRIGSLKNTDATLLTQKTVSWTNEPINILGVWVSCNHEEIIRKNYSELYTKAKVALSTWVHKSMSLIAKVIVINSLIISLFGYRMMALPSCGALFYQQFKTLVTDFLWNGKRAKIAYKTLILAKKDGGLGLVDLKLKGNSLRLAWIQILHAEPKLSNLVYSNIAPALKCKIWSCNLRSYHVKLFINNFFWKQILETWCDFKDSQIMQTDVADQLIWCNSNILVAGRPICWEPCINAGLLYVSQLVENNSFISAITAVNRYKLDFVSYKRNFSIFT